MEPAEKYIEDRLRDLGINLASPPTDVDELLLLLDQTEIYLSRVEQSPSTSMSDALRPAMNSLITKEFLNHPETDVKVFVAACITEITRITAPDAPYNDALMKEIFAMIVDSFGKLDDISGCSYSKRVSILETVAKIRSSVVMLDLECDDLIIQMFKNFLQSIRPDHPIKVFSSMETIMTLVLEESEDISQELLICLLSNVQKSKKDVMPVACKLAENVIHNSAMKLKPYFLVYVQSMGTSLSDYSGIVASVSQGSSVAVEQKEVDANKLSERAVSDELPQESEKLDKPVSCLEEAGNFTDKAREVLSNGAMPLGNGKPFVEQISQELKPESTFSSEQCRNDIAPIVENNNLGPITEKPCNELDLKFIEAKSSTDQFTDDSDSSWVDGDKQACAPIIGNADRKRKTKSLKSDGASDMTPATELILKPEREAELRPLEGLSGDNTRFNSAFPICIPPGFGLPKRGQAANSQISAMKSSAQKPAPSAGNEKNSGSTTMEKEDLHAVKMSQNTFLEKEDSPAVVSEHKKDTCPVSNSDGKPALDSSKKSLEDNATVDVAADVIGDGKSVWKEQKEAATKVAEASTFEKHRESKIKSQSKDVTESCVPAEPCMKEMLDSSKPSREGSIDKDHMGKFLVTSPKKKRRRKTNMHQKIIGREIEVWWPDDEKFYKGVIDAFDPITNNHRIVYDDGDVENLFLKNECWHFIDSKNLERGQENDIASPESSLQLPMKNPRASPGKCKATLTPTPTPTPTPQRGKSRGRPRQVTSKAGTSPNVELDTAIDRDNTSSKVISEGKNIIPSDFVGTSVIRSIDRPSDRTTKSFDSLIETPEDPVIKDGTTTGAKLDGKFKGNPTGRPRGRPRRKRKGTEVVITGTDVNVFVIKNREEQEGEDDSDLGRSPRSSVKGNKRRRL